MARLSLSADGMFDAAVAQIPLLAALSENDRERLRPYATARPVAARQAVWRAPEAACELLFLLRGRVKLTRSSESGRDVILDTCQKGELLCGSAACAGTAYCCSAAALHEPVEILAIPRRAVLELLERSPAAARAFLQEGARREMALVRRIEELSSGHVERRLATLLLRLAEQVGTPVDAQSTWLPIVLSRQDLADLCGTTVETAIRTMTRFGQTGLVRTADQGFFIADTERLADIAHGRA